MTIAELLQLITEDTWHLDENGCLSSDENHDCPLWYAYRHIDPDGYDAAEDYIDAGVRIGLREKSASAIATAADNRGEPKLRKRLLKAAGVAELKKGTER